MNYGKPTFKWDLDWGEGTIGNLEKFREADSLLRLDLLSDWIHALQEEYELAYFEFVEDYEARQAKAKSS